MKRISDNYYIKVFGESDWSRIEKGIPVDDKMFEGFDLFLHKNAGGYWMVSEGKTGCSLAQLFKGKRTKEAAIAALKENLNVTKFPAVINKTIRLHGYTARYDKDAKIHPLFRTLDEDN